MKVLHLSNSDSGGAGRAAYRLHMGLQSHSVDSRILVQYKSNDDETVVLKNTNLDKVISKLKLTEYLDIVPLYLYGDREAGEFSPQWIPNTLRRTVTQQNPDLINLHWVGKGYLRVETLAKFKKPLVWTLHDMWAFTGGCHYSQSCDRYKDSCGACPQLHSSNENDLSRWIWERKAKAWKDLNLTIVTPSLWLAKCANSSSLFKGKRIEVIPNGLSIQKYKPINRQLARQILNLPQDKHIILFGAMYPSDKRKGVQLLQPALQSLSKSGWHDKIEVVVFGGGESGKKPDLSFKSHYMGRLSDDVSLAVLYAAADVFVAPSTEDNLPNTIMEALACGTPCVGFKIGGIPDMIEHQQNGYLATPLDSEDLARGIAWTIENRERHQKLCARAREKAEQEFSRELQARRYLSVFEDILSVKKDTALENVLVGAKDSKARMY